jgi:hypothetical protein
MGGLTIITIINQCFLAFAGWQSHGAHTSGRCQTHIHQASV